MCEFISWVEKDSKVYFLTDKMVYGTLISTELLVNHNSNICRCKEY
jgi:hypothetical protein